MSTTYRGDSVGGRGPSSGGEGEGNSGGGGYSYRASELPKAQVKDIKAQNAAADSMKSKDLDAVDRGAKAAQTRKENQALAEDMAHDAGYRKGIKTGAAVGAGATASAAIALGAIEKKKGTQPNHAVTDNNNHTKPINK